MSRVDKMILHTRIPVIKATARMWKQNVELGQREIINIPIDISIDSLAHRSPLIFSLFLPSVRMYMYVQVYMYVCVYSIGAIL